MPTMFAMMIMGVCCWIAGMSMFVRMDVGVFMTMSVLRTVSMLMDVLVRMFVWALHSASSVTLWGWFV